MTTTENANQLDRSTLEDVLSRLAATVARRANDNGETFEEATRRVLVDFTAEWPELAAAMVAAAVADQERAEEHAQNRRDERWAEVV